MQATCLVIVAKSDCPMDSSPMDPMETSGVCATTEESLSWLQRFRDFEIVKELLHLWVHSKLTFDVARPDLDNITARIFKELHFL